MNSDQKLIAIIGVVLIILTAATTYRPYLVATFLSGPPGSGSGSGSGGSSSKSGNTLPGVGGDVQKVARIANKRYHVVGPPNKGPGGISSPQILPGLSRKIYNSPYFP